MAHTLIHHVSYNLWANERMGHLMMAQDDALLQQVQKSSFASINKTLLHIWDAEVIWHCRLQGKSLGDWPSKNFAGDKTEMLHGFIAHSAALTELVSAQPESFFEKTITYKNLKGDPFESTVEEILFHVVNHGTYHRGQIISMLRSAGVTQVANTDLIAWFREQKSKKI
jgi:uncharacterized damage-inducible protein DinB